MRVVVDKVWLIAIAIVVAVIAGFGGVLLTDLYTGANPSHAAALNQVNVLLSSGSMVGYEVEIADEEGEHQRGLMYRRSMPKDHGMLFIFQEAEEQAFWMKNTYISLDMLFADSQGKIQCIHNNTKRLDTSLYRCQQPIQYVLEINAGEADAHGFAVGDQLNGSFLP